jgi:hypothetical protein
MKAIALMAVPLFFLIRIHHSKLAPRFNYFFESTIWNFAKSMPWSHDSSAESKHA